MNKDKELIKIMLGLVNIEKLEDGKYRIWDNEYYGWEEITKEQHDRLEDILEE